MTGAFMGFVPLLSILLPLKVQALHPSARGGVLSSLLVEGAVAASGSAVLAGWLSDRTRTRAGRRSPWILGGTFGTCASLAMIAGCKTMLQLTLAFILLQLCVNAVLGPLNAVLADDVPEDRRSRIAGWLAMSYPLATLIGTPVVGGLLRSDGLRYGAVVVFILATLLPFAVRLGLAGVGPAARGERPSVATRTRTKDPTYHRFWAARFFMQCAISPLNGYLLFYLEDVQHLGAHPEAEVALLGALSTCAGLLAGPLFGRLASSPLIRGALAGLAAVLVALGLGLLAAGHWPARAALPVILVVIGVGYGGYTALDTALAGELVAARPNAARDLGLFNLAHTAPQVIAPLYAGLVLNARSAGGGYALLFGLGAASSLLAGWAFLAADLRIGAVDSRTTSSKGRRAAV